MVTISLIIVALILVLLNGFFVAAEFAIVRLRGTQLESIHSDSYAGRTLKIIHAHLDEYLSACQLGITLASLGLGWIGEPAFAHIFEKFFHPFLASAFATLSSFLLAFFIISYLHIVVGELAPKSLAIRKVEQVAIRTAVPLYYFYWIMYPVIWLLNQSAVFVLRLVGVDTQQIVPSYSSKELKIILSASHLHEDLTKADLRILNRVLDFTDLSVADLMRPIQEMKAIDVEQSIPQIVAYISQQHFSRYPMYENNQRQVILGILHVKDLLEYIVQKKPLTSILLLKRPILDFELMDPAIDVFHQFRTGSGHFAIVKNDVGKCVGFITLDDVLSEALGHIRDEFITPHRDWYLTKEGNYIVYGYTSLYTLERLLKIDLTEHESATISGLILSRLGAMPLQDECLSFEKFDLQVLKVNGPRIELVKIVPKPTQAAKITG